MRLDYWGTLSFLMLFSPSALSWMYTSSWASLKGFLFTSQHAVRDILKKMMAFYFFFQCMLFLCIGAHGDLSLNDSVFNLEHTQDPAPSHLWIQHLVTIWEISLCLLWFHQFMLLGNTPEHQNTLGQKQISDTHSLYQLSDIQPILSNLTWFSFIQVIPS